MSRFWPKDFELNDTQTPMEILRDAQNEWQTSSGGVLALLFQEAKSESGNDMIIVHASHVPRNRSATLFSVVHRAGTPYPVTIQPKGDDLPNILKKSYYKPGLADLGGRVGGMQGGKVVNEWVSESPVEFRSNLENVFNLGVVRSTILNLVSSVSENAGDDRSEAPDEQADKD